MVFVLSTHMRRSLDAVKVDLVSGFLKIALFLSEELDRVGDIGASMKEGNGLAADVGELVLGESYALDEEVYRHVLEVLDLKAQVQMSE